MPADSPNSPTVRTPLRMRGLLPAALMALALLLSASPLSRLLAPLERGAFDASSRALRALHPTALSQDVVIVGIDEAALESISEPPDLWHAQYASVLSALAAAQPAVIGMAVHLPVRSLDFLRPGLDESLASALRSARRTVPVVVGLSAGSAGSLQPLSQSLLEAVGPGVSSLVLCPDPDGTVRRLPHAESSSCPLGPRPAFALAMADAMGHHGASAGLIDFSSGSRLTYLPFFEVLGWANRGEGARLEALVKGRPVVMASLRPGDDKVRMPVVLAGWESGQRDQASALAHVQALRTLIGHGPIEPLGWAAQALLLLLPCLWWLGSTHRAKVVLWVMTLVLTGVASVWGMWQGLALPVGGMMLMSILAFGARLLSDLIRDRDERFLLRNAFAGHVSPQTLRAILAGRLQPDADGSIEHVTILFADIRGFTKRSEISPPEQTIDLLNRYFAAISGAIHRRGGAVDKFIGDGVMATFGMPQPLPMAERNALEAAQDMLVEVRRLNEDLVRRGLAPIEIGIGIHAGQVHAGYIGSRKRREFTVIGDAVNTASRLEGLTKSLGYPIVCSEAVAGVVGPHPELVDLGEQAITGRSPMRLYGWRPSVLSAPSALALQGVGHA